MVKTFSYDEINEIFTKDGDTHLVSVEICKTHKGYSGSYEPL
jgi:hypothetical protein